jgi:hypothetical protein
VRQPGSPAEINMPLPLLENNTLMPYHQGSTGDTTSNKVHEPTETSLRDTLEAPVHLYCTFLARNGRFSNNWCSWVLCCSISFHIGAILQYDRPILPGSSTIQLDLDERGRSAGRK